jgi:hypothetical protein
VSNDPETSSDADGGLGRTVKAVAMSIVACTVILAGLSLVFANTRFALGVLIGGAIGAANFLVLARVGKAITGKSKDAAFWGAMYLLKVAALFGGVFLVLHSGLVSGLGVVVGLTALVPGIVVGGLLSTPRDPTQPGKDGGAR